MGYVEVVKQDSATYRIKFQSEMQIPEAIESFLNVRNFIV